MSKYYIVLDWMVHELKLKGAELSAYAIIHGFCRDNAGEYTGGIKYIMDMTNAARRTAIATLQSLCDKGLVQKREVIDSSGIRRCYYTTTKCSHDGEAEATVTKEAPKKSFVKPTVEEVRMYCEERQNGIDAEQFVDYYTARGWKVGSSPMRDWKAAVRTWERRNAWNKPKEVNPYAGLGAEDTF